MPTKQRATVVADRTGETPAGAPGCAREPAAVEDVARALGVLEGRWKMLILYHLFGAPADGPGLRFSALERAIPAVTQKMLIQQLRELERDGVVRRTMHPEVPPRVEYALTSHGRALGPAIGALVRWARRPTADPS